MWSYYGAKTNIVHLYPPPKYGKIIEPFAGTARYALKYWDREVLLVDKYPVITDIWKWLQKCSAADITGLPRFDKGDNINEVEYDCIEARYLVGFLVGFGFTDPRKTASPRLRNRPNAMNFTIAKIAGDLHKIRHWEIRCSSYENITNEPATWFIDPPYQFGGHAYKMNNKKIDFHSLGAWSMEREGQVIVCENDKSDWMPFIPLADQNTHTGTQKEVFWTNEPTSYGIKQQTLFHP